MIMIYMPHKGEQHNSLPIKPNLEIRLFILGQFKYVLVIGLCLTISYISSNNLVTTICRFNLIRKNKIHTTHIN
jgi:hypothetical protein